MSRTSIITLPVTMAAALFLIATPLVAQEEAAADSTPKKATRELPLEPGQTLEFTADEATWISLDISPDGQTLVFDLLGDLYTLPVAGGTATRLTSGMAYDAQPRFSPDGTRVVFLSDRSGGENIWIMDLDGSDTTQVTRGNSQDYLSPEWTPDGDYVVASRGRSGKLWMYHVDGGSGIALIDEPANLHITGPTFGADDRYIWYSRRTGRWDYNAAFPQYQLAVYDRDTGTSTTMTSRYGSAVRPTLSPDGNWLVYGTRHDGDTGLRIRDLDTGDERWLAYPVQRDEQESLGSLDTLPGYTFTPDSEALVLSYGGKIWRVAVDGSGQVEIPFQAQVELDLGPEVRFEYEVEADQELEVRQIRDAVPSPDGSRLAFSALGRIYVMDYPDGAPRALTDETYGAHQPSWSPDGAWLAFASWDDEDGGHIHRIPSDGSGPAQRLTTTPGYFEGTVWSPDGERIVSIRGSVRDVQEARGGFGGGLGAELVWVPATGGQTNVIALASGRGSPHFTNASDRIYAYSRARGLVSFRWDGTDERAHVIVRGQAGPGGGQGPTADLILMAPEGDQAIAMIDTDLFTVTVPRVGGETPTISVANPENATFPARKLTEVGGQFPAWSGDAAEVHWSIGNAHFVYNLAEADAFADSVEAAAAAADDDPDEEEEADEEEEEEEDEDEARYQPRETRIVIRVARDIPNGVAVLRGGRAITMNGDEIIENSDILVRNNRIEAVGPSGSLDVPDGAEIIDISGTTVVPGFVDIHYHTQWLITDIHSRQVWQYLTNLAYGVTTTQDVQTASTDILTYHDRVETGSMIGPRIYHTGPGVFSGENISSLDQARDVLRRYKDYYKLNTFKMYMSGNRQQRQWLIMAARELELMPTTEGGLDFKLNMTHTIDGYPGLEHSLPIAPLYDDVLRLYVETQTTYSPTLIVSYGGPFSQNWFFATEDLFGSDKLLGLMPYEYLEAKASRRGGGGSEEAGWFRWNEHVFYKHGVFLKDLIEAGGRVGVGAHGEFHGPGYHWELWGVQSGGMSEHDALRAATILGAEAIGFGNDLGSIEGGKLADLVILNSDPLADIRNSEDIRYVMKNGRLYDANSLDEIYPENRPLPGFYWQRQAPTELSVGVPGGMPWNR